MFCHICASKAVMDSQLYAIDQAWDPKTGKVNPKASIKYKAFTWNEETCPHQGDKNG